MGRAATPMVVSVHYGGEFTISGEHCARWPTPTIFPTYFVAGAIYLALRWADDGDFRSGGLRLKDFIHRTKHPDIMANPDRTA